MEGPDFFLLLIVAAFLCLGFSACILTGAVWLFFGSWKKSRPVQFLSALPFGVGVLVFGPALFLLLLFVGFCFSYGGCHRNAQSPNPPPTQGQHR